MVVSVVVAYEDTVSGRYSASSESCLTGATTVLLADFRQEHEMLTGTMINLMIMG